jgi:hypothetical protein
MSILYSKIYDNKFSIIFASKKGSCKYADMQSAAVLSDYSVPQAERQKKSHPRV